MSDVLKAIKPRGQSSAAIAEALEKIDAAFAAVDADEARLKLERSDMLLNGASNSDLRRCETALADLALDRERLTIAEPAMRLKYSEAVNRETAEARRDKREVAVEAIEKFNALIATGAYTEAAQRIVALIEAERAAYRAIAAYDRSPMAAMAPGVAAEYTPPLPDMAKAYNGANARSLESMVQLPAMAPNTPPFAFWRDPSAPRGEAAMYMR
jgi:hypothetical protein